MKPVQVVLDEKLLRELDATPEVQLEGRSAVLRRAIAEYLERRRRMAVREGYERAYGSAHPEDDELAGWDAEGVWPDE